MTLLQPTDPIEIMKQKAALRALERVRDGMKLGLGTGSTARYFVDGLGQKVAEGLDVVCVPTSEVTRVQAESLNIPMAELGDLRRLDLTVDGADEITQELYLIKGGGGALLREKIVAAASDAMIVIADDTKLVTQLGAYALPVEVNKFAHGATAAVLRQVFETQDLSGPISLRGGDTPFETDGGHFIYDCALENIAAPHALAAALLNVPGVVEHGLFLTYATAAVLAGADSLREYGAL
ncbi:MAG TPA: ribose 5-phosphate isomerase A [Rhodobiaceae bacterium]|nr:ribose 5-phosphate isomerase A [Rhodobiaceae bacterium]|tara:strand:- start:2618 stop:3331 length:714 start_codon:yes stop_codon:yes gene_type:complete